MGGLIMTYATPTPIPYAGYVPTFTPRCFFGEWMDTYLRGKYVGFESDNPKDVWPFGVTPYLERAEVDHLIAEEVRRGEDGEAVDCTFEWVGDDLKFTPRDGVTESIQPQYIRVWDQAILVWSLAPLGWSWASEDFPDWRPGVMKKSDLIAKLAAIPGDPIVCIYTEAQGWYSHVGDVDAPLTQMQQVEGEDGACTIVLNLGEGFSPVDDI
jgi:hypothetical protein